MPLRTAYCASDKEIITRFVISAPRFNVAGDATATGATGATVRRVVLSFQNAPVRGASF